MTTNTLAALISCVLALAMTAWICLLGLAVIRIAAQADRRAPRLMHAPRQHQQRQDQQQQTQQQMQGRTLP